MLFWETGAVGSMPGPGPGRYFFRVAPSGAELGRTAVDFIVGQLAPAKGVSSSALRFAVINVTDPYGDEVAKGALDEIGARGLDLAAHIGYDPRRYDAAAIVQQIAASGANVVFAAAYLQDGVAVRRQMVAQHLQLVANIGTSSSYCMPEFGAQLGRDALGLFASDKPDGYALDPTGLLPSARALLERADHAYEDRFHEEMSAPALAGFAAAWALFHDVLPRASTDTPDAVAAAALAARIPQGGLPNGSGLRFSGSGVDAGNNDLAASVIWEWVAVGRRAVVWPPRFATRSMVPMTPLA
jgi:ABC-type branched-subunit amino acid transport system substrate-binding protein